MEPTLTVEELETRWNETLEATRRAAAADPVAYRRLKTRAAGVLENPVDINDYFPTVDRLIECLKSLDPCGQGSIFDIFCKRISPDDVWQVRDLRLECRSLLAHLDAFDRWKREKICLRRVK
jgi:hypothetical protein